MTDQNVLTKTDGFVQELFHNSNEFRHALTSTQVKDEYIENVLVTNVNVCYLAELLADRLFSKVEFNKTILTYCLDRLLRLYRLYDIRYWVPNISSTGKTFIGFRPIHPFIDFFYEAVTRLLDVKTELEAIRFYSGCEHGAIPYELNDVEYFGIGHMDLGNIRQWVVKDKIADFNMYNKQWLLEDKQQIPNGIFIKLENDYYLFDGYQRLLGYYDVVEKMGLNKIANKNYTDYILLG